MLTKLPVLTLDETHIREIDRKTIYVNGMMIKMSYVKNSSQFNYIEMIENIKSYFNLTLDNVCKLRYRGLWYIGVLASSNYYKDTPFPDTLSDSLLQQVRQILLFKCIFSISCNFLSNLVLRTYTDGQSRIVSIKDRSYSDRTFIDRFEIPSWILSNWFNEI